MPGAKQNLDELIDRSIEANEDDLLKLLDESLNEIYVFDKKSLQFVYVNGSARTNLGYSLEELAELTPVDLKPEYNLASFRERIAPLLNGDSKKLQFETTHQRKNGSIYPAEVHLQLAHYRNRQVCTASILDITTRKEQEEERRNFDQKMQQSQKLESLGILAGGVAHDFNNILTSILGYSDLAQQSLKPGMPANDHMNEIVKSALQASELIRQMLDYSGKGKFVAEPIDLSALVDDMGRLLEVSISRKCVLKYYSVPNLPSIEADISQLRQVIMNLVINASESIADRSGVIAISTGAMFCDSDYLSETYLDENLPEGLYVYLEVADTGQGMDEETQLKIFDPFFTTKFTGRGLGLAAILGIVRGHRGGIKVYSELDKGTTFKVLLPACSQQLASELELENNSPNWKAS